MILGGKLPGKVGRCRFLFCKLFLQYRGKIAVMLSFFHFGNVSTFRKDGFLRSSMRHRRKEGNHETCRTAPARYMDVAGFLLPWFTHNRDKKLRTCVPFLLYPKRVLHQLGPPTQRENRLLHQRVTPPKSLDTLNMTDCLFSHTLVWFTTPKY